MASYPRKDPKLCSDIRDRKNKWDNYWSVNRKLYYEWIDFVMGDQWREDESKLFERYNKIPLMFNKLGVLMNHLQGDQIQNTPNLQISPDENVPVEAAQTRAALIKNISLNSDAKTVYQTAYGQAVVGGYGAFRLGTEYLDGSFDQEIKVYDFSDPNLCYWDLSAKHRCKVDGLYAGFATRRARKEIKNVYGVEVESQIGSSALTEENMWGFADDDSIMQLDDFERESRRESIYKLADITKSFSIVIDEDEFKQLEKRKINGKRYIIYNDIPMTKIDEREEIKYTIRHRQIAGDFVLAETVFPTKTLLPIIFVDQHSYFTKQGQQITRSFFKDVKDAQKYLNYLATQSAYIMKVSRYDQFMAPRKCISAPDIQQIWRDPSVVQGALPYDETPSGLKPEKLNPPELSASLSQQYERTLIDIQSGTGLFNTQIGEMGNEVSGTAIDRRNLRGSKNTQISRTALDVAIATSGLVINEMIPEVYDTERTLVLPTPNSQEEKIRINEPADPYGMSVKNDMTKGNYKIRLKAGASYEGQKQEALESLQSVLMADKSGQVFPMIADLYAENLPLDNNMELRNRLRTIVPQEVIEAGKTGKPLPPKQPQPSPDEMMMQLKQAEMQQRAQQAQMDYQLKLKDIEFKQAEIQRKAIEMQHDMTLELEKIEAEKEEAAAELQETILRYQAENQRIGADLQINHSQNLIKLLTHHPKHLDNKGK